ACAAGRRALLAQRMSTAMRATGRRTLGTRDVHPQAAQQQSQPALLETIGFIGGGNMAGALARGVIAASLLEPRKIIVSDPVQRVRQGLSRDGMSVTESNLDVVASSNVVVLAVKPDKI